VSYLLGSGTLFEKWEYYAITFSNFGLFFFFLNIKRQIWTKMPNVEYFTVTFWSANKKETVSDTCLLIASVIELCLLSPPIGTGWDRSNGAKLDSLAPFTRVCFQPFQLVAEEKLNVQSQHVFWACHSEEMQLRGDEVSLEYLPTISAWWASVSC